MVVQGGQDKAGKVCFSANAANGFLWLLMVMLGGVARQARFVFHKSRTQDRRQDKSQGRRQDRKQGRRQGRHARGGAGNRAGGRAGGRTDKSKAGGGAGGRKARVSAAVRIMSVVSSWGKS